MKQLRRITNVLFLSLSLGAAAGVVLHAPAVQAGKGTKKKAKEEKKEETKPAEEKPAEQKPAEPAPADPKPEAK